MRSSFLFILALFFALHLSFSKFSCPTGQKAIQNGESINTNGCGPQGGGVNKVITLIGNELAKDFKSCCNAHDICWSTCGKTQNTCDSDFYSCMKSVCKKKGALSEAACKIKAKSFKKIVSENEAGFKESQKGHCECVENS